MSDWILLQSGVILYLALFLFLMGGAIGLPIPEDLTLFLGGILAHRGSADPRLVLLVCYLGSVLGDILIFFAGRRLGKNLNDKEWFKSRVNPIRFQQIKLGLEKRSFLMIFVARHLFYLRTVTFLTCGAVRMSFGRFILADAVSALVSVPLMVGLGYLGSENYDRIVEVLRKTKILFFAATMIGAGLFYLHWKRRQREAEDGRS